MLYQLTQTGTPNLLFLIFLLDTPFAFELDSTPCLAHFRLFFKPLIQGSPVPVSLP